MRPGLRPARNGPSRRPLALARIPPASPPRRALAQACLAPRRVAGALVFLSLLPPLLQSPSSPLTIPGNHRAAAMCLLRASLNPLGSPVKPAPSEDGADPP